MRAEPLIPLCAQTFSRLHKVCCKTMGLGVVEAFALFGSEAVPEKMCRSAAHAVDAGRVHHMTPPRV